MGGGYALRQGCPPPCCRVLQRHPFPPRHRQLHAAVWLPVRQGPEEPTRGHRGAGPGLHLSGKRREEGPQQGGYAAAAVLFSHQILFSNMIFYCV